MALRTGPPSGIGFLGIRHARDGESWRELARQSESSQTDCPAPTCYGRHLAAVVNRILAYRKRIGRYCRQEPCRCECVHVCAGVCARVYVGWADEIGAGILIILDVRFVR